MAMPWHSSTAGKGKLEEEEEEGEEDEEEEQAMAVSPAHQPFQETSASRSSKRASSSYCTQQEEMAEGDVSEDGLPQLEKKKRLTSEQVEFLEHSFELENRLGPERKLVIAKTLGLQPKQVSVWFQNRRARWKTKQLEHEFHALKANYAAVLKENEGLQNEISSLNALLNEMNKKNGTAQEQALAAMATEKEAVPSLTAVTSKSVDDAEGLSPKMDSDSPTKSDQSEVLDPRSYAPASDVSLFRFEDSAAAATFYSDGLLECMYSRMLLQPIAVKLDGSMPHEENPSPTLTWEEPIFCPYYS